MRYLKFLIRLFIRVGYGFAYWFGCQILRPVQLSFGGRKVKIAPTASIKFPGNIKVGRNVFINHNCSVWASQISCIEIGDDVLMGPGVVIVSSNHGMKLGMPIAFQPERNADVVIGSDVWIGANSVVLPGVKIGNGCVIGAGSVVSRDLPDNSICVGVPAKAVRQREL